MSTRLWILGAADPEMQAIETLLSSRGETVVYASIADKRCLPSNAYRANCLTGVSASNIDGYDPVIFVECDLPGYFSGDPAPKITVVDHHRPGDPGYGCAPEDYWEASSIGQVSAILDEPVTGPSRLVAAADHCLAHAYSGECPGVDPDALMQWRVTSRATFQGRPEATVMADIEAARQEIRAAVSVCQNCGGRRVPGTTTVEEDRGGCDGAHIFPEYADLRGRKIPELPEASAREGIPFLADGLAGSDKRAKVVLQSAPPELVQRFLNGEIVQGLYDSYGDPARGFAGGYIS